MLKYYYPCLPNRLHVDSPYLRELDKSPKWVAEVKRNGWRCGAYRGLVLTLWTRKKTTIDDPLPTLREALFNMIPEQTIIDGELLEKRTKTVKELFYAFDIIVYRNNPVFMYLWKERRLLLESVIKPIKGLVELSIPVNIGKTKLYYDSIGTEDCEGIVLKKVDSPYLVGARDCPQNPYWLKVKRAEKCQYADKR